VCDEVQLQDRRQHGHPCCWQQQEALRWQRNARGGWQCNAIGDKERWALEGTVQLQQDPGWEARPVPVFRALVY